MKKFIAIVILCISSFSAVAQNQVTKEIGDFDEIKVYDGISVKLIKSEENKAIIKGVNKSDVEIVNKAGILKVRMNISKTFDGYDTFVEIYYTSTLYVIDANEKAFIENTEAFEQTEITLKAQEGGEIDVKLAVEKANIKAVTGGIITTSGTTTNQEITINSGGQYEGMEFTSEQTTVSVSAGGMAEIYATKYVDAKVKAGGEIDIFGSPKVIDEQTFLGGKIRKRD